MALAVGAVTHLRPRCPTDFPSSAMKNLRPAQSQLSADLHSRRLLPCLFYTSRRSPRLFTVSAAAVSVEKTEKDRFPISVTETKQPRSSVSLGIEVPPTICTESYNKVLHEFSKQAKLLSIICGECRFLRTSMSTLSLFLGRSGWKEMHEYVS